MKFDHLINIDILSFFRTGAFDYLKPGQSREWILQNFPDPDDYSVGKDRMSAPIWFYGTIELHFNGDKLSAIYSDNIRGLSGGPSIQLIKWILEDPAALTLSYCISQLNLQRIDFTKKTEKFHQEYIRLHLAHSRLVLSFLDEDNKITDPNAYLLSSFSLSEQ